MSSISQMTNSLESLNQKLDQTEERMSKLKHGPFKIPHSDRKKKKNPNK
jgi:hypothetical protein